MRIYIVPMEFEHVILIRHEYGDRYLGTYFWGLGIYRCQQEVGLSTSVSDELAN